MRPRPINPLLLLELYRQRPCERCEKRGHTPRYYSLAHLVSSLNPHNIDHLPGDFSAHGRPSPFVFSLNLLHDPFDVSRRRHLPAFYIHHVDLGDFAEVGIGEADVRRAETFKYTEESREIYYRDDCKP
jgi:hypothetical protein